MKRMAFILIVLLYTISICGQEEVLNGYLTINPGANDSYQQGIRIKESKAK